MLNCLAYLAQVIAGVLLPQFAEMVANIAVPLQFGEIAIMLWLVIMGARQRVVTPTRLRSAALRLSTRGRPGFCLVTRTAKRPERRSALTGAICL